ncbi:hypothetical protein B0I35DRAFT_193886 [Stachybotrys elegans]|uniref:Uncharacterized protein n=1 Tax=Stachybotrys elegans TaxID=80388 RepID=A0A8K0WUG9_9HYPO|nr:hypothetical protein B0I35DRAFT_193886 [Stachybotrys elegans]
MDNGGNGPSKMSGHGRDHALSLTTEEMRNDTVTRDADAEPVESIATSFDKSGTSTPTKAYTVESKTPAPTLAATIWRPRFLRTTSLLIFIVFMLLLFSAMLVLYALSRENNGIVTTSSALHYLWRFAPVAGRLYPHFQRLA